MCREVTINIHGVNYVRNPEDRNSVVTLLVNKGIDRDVALVVSVQCEMAMPGRRVKVRVPGVQIHT